MNDISNENQNSNQLCNAVIHVNDKHVLSTRLYKKKTHYSTKLRQKTAIPHNGCCITVAISIF